MVVIKVMKSVAMLAVFAAQSSLFAAASVGKSKVMPGYLQLTQEIRIATVNQKLDDLAHLLHVGAPVNSRDSFGRTPLYYAVETKNMYAAEMLLLNGADVMSSQRHPVERLHLATKSSNIDLIKRLGQKYWPYQFFLEDRTPLHCACKHANIPMIHLLLDHGAWEMSAVFSVTPLMLLMEHAASEDQVLAVLDRLLEVGKPNVSMTKVPFEDETGKHDYMNPLVKALVKGYSRVVRRLLDWFKEHGEALDNSGVCYIIGFAVLCNSEKDNEQRQAILDDLLSLGADPAKHNSNNLSAFHFIILQRLAPQFLDSVARNNVAGLFQSREGGLSPEALAEEMKIKEYKPIFKKARAAQISQTVEQLQTTFEDEDGLIQEYDMQIGDASRLLEYAAIFKDVPGYGKHRENLLRHGAVKRLSDKTAIQRGGHVGNARGSRFELEAAFDLRCAKKQILQFGAIYDGKEFDIEIPGSLIECKDINWSLQKRKKLGEFLLDHKAIAERLGKKYKFYSRRPIPDAWKAWLNDKGIEFKDTLDVTSRDSTREYEQGPTRSSSSNMAASSSL